MEIKRTIDEVVRHAINLAACFCFVNLVKHFSTTKLTGEMERGYLVSGDMMTDNRVKCVSRGLKLSTRGRFKVTSSNVSWPNMKYPTQAKSR